MFPHPEPPPFLDQFDLGQLGGAAMAMGLGLVAIGAIVAGIITIFRGRVIRRLVVALVLLLGLVALITWLLVTKGPWT